MPDGHTIAKWSIVGTILSAVIGSAFFLLYEAIGDIQHEQVAIRKELALQTADLESIRQRQIEILTAFDAVKIGQTSVRAAVHAGNLALALELGRVILRGRRLRMTDLDKPLPAHVCSRMDLPIGTTEREVIAMNEKKVADAKARGREKSP